MTVFPVLRKKKNKFARSHKAKQENMPNKLEKIRLGMGFGARVTGEPEKYA